MAAPDPLIFIFAFLLDQIMGDPPKWPHPVVGMGKIISRAERLLNKGTPRARRIKGAALTIFLVTWTYLLTYTVLTLVKSFNLFIGLGLEIYLISTTLAGKSLLDAGRSVLKPLKKGDLLQARQRLSWYVSRDTTNLRENEIVRGTVETLAENFVDGILSPLTFAAIGGAPLAMAFKAVSTLDSMIGYRNERFADFGWFAARTDDVANYLPARFSVLILLIAGWFYRMPVSDAFHIWQRDAKKHPSPNGGNPESVVAGLLGVRLGGVNIYHGKVHYRAELGDPVHPLNSEDIIRCLKLIRLATWLSIWPLAGLSWIL